MRLLGPTRPSHGMDLLGNELSLTRPHPYSYTPMAAAKVRFNHTLRLSMPNYQSEAEQLAGDPILDLTIFHKNYFLRSIKKIARGFVSDDVKIMDVTSVVLESDIYYSDVTYFNEFVVDYSDGYNHTNTNEFVAKVMDAYELAAEQVPDGEMNNFTSTLQAQAKLSPSEAVRSSLVNATIGLPPDYTRPFTLADGPTNHTEFMELVTPNPNPYTDFCKAGCTYFFSEVVTTEEPTKLSNCTAKCDFTYRSAAHITVGYSDIAETARLECRDGCQIALKRCQPGYKCSQVAMYLDDAGEEQYVDGEMAICPPGTYRDVQYDQVENCVDCPPGRYREDEKGRYMESCTKCPVGKYVNKTGSAKTLECNRCPAGRFGPEPGLALCKCITETSCEDPQEYPSPANAERRESFPFEGRW